MGLFQRKKPEAVPVRWMIERRCLNLILESSKSNFPNEFGALLRVDKIAKTTITEVVLLPGTISGDSHAIFKLYMLPIDYSIVGTVHSHPSSISRPSEADLDLFSHFGRIHLIVGVSSLGGTSWRAYDYKGNEVQVQVV
ncbi:MAG TPA: Mov34/MPN/PAD-1 family protein [Candidatus Thermoplasmatota archaeon]|nr:Mov34/MPN/PAD-1 family protein [Candidatus Thermoplasmatota archaeon]